jgi:hypothetical protein
MRGVPNRVRHLASAIKPVPGRDAANDALALDHPGELGALLETMAHRDHYADAGNTLACIATGQTQGHRVIQTMIGHGLQPDARIYRMVLDFHLFSSVERIAWCHQTPELGIKNLIDFARKRKRRRGARLALHCLSYVETPDRTWLEIGDASPGIWPRDVRERAALTLALLVKLHTGERVRFALAARR